MAKTMSMITSFARLKVIKFMSHLKKKTKCWTMMPSRRKTQITILRILTASQPKRMTIPMSQMVIPMKMNMAVNKGADVILVPTATVAESTDASRRSLASLGFNSLSIITQTSSRI
jgi:hypothetical protein